MRRIGQIAVASCFSLGALGLAAIGGCGSRAHRSGSVLGAGTSPADRALVSAEVIPLPESGATQLASTAWSGEASCELTGDVTVSINEDPTFPAEVTLEFDEKGFPVGFFDGLLAVDSDFPVGGLGPTIGIGMGMGSEVPRVPKLADFTPRSFDLAYSRTLTYSMMGATIEEGEVGTLEGTLSDDGTALTGTLRVTGWTAVSARGDKETITSGQRCVFTLAQRD